MISSTLLLTLFSLFSNISRRRPWRLTTPFSLGRWIPLYLRSLQKWQQWYHVQPKEPGPIRIPNWMKKIQIIRNLKMRNLNLPLDLASWSLISQLLWHITARNGSLIMLGNHVHGGRRSSQLRLRLRLHQSWHYGVLGRRGSSSLPSCVYLQQSRTCLLHLGNGFWEHLQSNPSRRLRGAVKNLPSTVEMFKVSFFLDTLDLNNETNCRSYFNTATLFGILWAHAQWLESYIYISTQRRDFDSEK